MKIQVLEDWSKGGAVGYAQRVIAEFDNKHDLYHWKETNEPGLKSDRVIIDDMVVYGWDEIEAWVEQ
jgi:hypothetical protein